MKFMEKVTEICTGCRMCEQICPHASISMQVDGEGFIVAQIDQSKCVDCGLCARRCPQNISNKLKYEVKRTLAARLIDDETLYKSASGGAFAGLALWAIKNGWIVYGVAFDENLVAHHVKATTVNELDAILSSKYVQSDPEHTYSEVRELLKEGHHVLYSGTPCQIAGLRSFIGKENPNLLLVDIVCHGVPSPLLFAKQIELLSIRHKKEKIKEYDFRDKRGGWGLGYKYKYKRRYKYGNCQDDAYYMYFLNGHTYRESCYDCRYCQTKRVGDITLADYWGVEKFHPEFYSTKGVSLVLINTEAGEKAWNNACDNFEWIESKLEWAVQKNQNLCHPTTRVPEVRNQVYKEIQDLPVEEYFKKHLPYRQSIKARLKHVLPMKLRLWLKNKFINK